MTRMSLYVSPDPVRLTYHVPPDARLFSHLMRQGCDGHSRTLTVPDADRIFLLIMLLMLRLTADVETCC